MEYFLSAFWSALELLGLYYFYNAFLEFRKSKQNTCLLFLIAWVVLQIALNLGISDALTQIISIAMLPIIGLCCYRGPMLQRILFAVLYYVLGGVIDSSILFGTSAILGISVSELVWRKLTYVVISTIIKLIIVFFSWFLMGTRKSHIGEPIRQKWIILSAVFPVISLGMMAVVFYSNREAEDLNEVTVVFSVLIAIANLAVLILMDAMEKSTAGIRNMALLNQRMEIQTDSILALERNYRAQRESTHEYRNQLQTIYDLLSVGQSDAATSYVRELQGMETTRIFAVRSNHPIIDAVMNQQYQRAQENNIDVFVQVNDLSGVSIATDQLVVLLSNLLDNAIEACLRLPGDRAIQCRLIKTDNLFISIRNTSPPVEIKDNHIETSKESKNDHGYGLSHIDFILKQLHAEYAFTFEDGWFEFVADIPIC